MRREKPIIGLCGGIGAGKSLVAREMQRLGGLVIDSDGIGHEVLRRAEVIGTLRAWWGDWVFDAAGRPDRRKIAELVFNDATEKGRLESLVHPLILALQEDMISNGLRDPKVSAIILDSPLLFESSLDQQCDFVVFIEVGAPERLRRLREERNWDEEELRRRESRQMPLAAKRSRSQFVIRNEGSIEQLCIQTKKIFGQIKAEHASVLDTDDSRK